ncbi:hypothetical protein [Devosia sp. SL43]|uniref:hypothetical protein n=1 Tax=Devosia sp. SL43 TaxID=2806348 RepID=UPI001F1E3664|nr:hypothetical protein [Devosia sp. SL43]UJW87940.1 hypothetical protein IM737_20515 [Devosia sp. SL43]
MAIASRRIHAMVSSHLEIMGQDFAELASALGRTADTLRALDTEAKLTGIDNSPAVNQAVREAAEDLARITKS